MTKHHSLDGSYYRKFSLTVLEAGKAKMKVSAGLDSGEDCSWFVDDHFVSLAEREGSGLVLFFYKFTSLL